MAFQGDLRNIGLATVFQNLQQNLQSGTLHVKRPQGSRFVYVTKGTISMVSAGPGTETPVGEYLRRAGKVSPEDIEAAQKRRRKGSRLGSVLEKNGTAEPDDVKQAVRKYIEEETYELFTWPAGSFEFQEGEPAAEVFDSEVRNAKLELDPNAVILEAARRVDEWERIGRVVGSMNEIYLVRRECAEEVQAKHDPRAGRVAELLDGTRDMAAVIRDSGLGRYAVSKVLSQLIQERLVRPISGEELRGLADAAESASNLEQAKTLLRRAIDLEPGDVDLRRRLAAVHERADERQEAASEYKLLANSLLDRGRSGEAADCLRRAIELMPTDVTTRERLFQIRTESGSMTVAIETGVDLADMYAQLGLNEKTVAALERILGLNPRERLPLEEKLVEANLAVGDVKGAIEVLRRISRRHYKTRDYDKAREFYERILKLDAKDDEARKRVAAIQEGTVERMRERRIARIRGGIIAGVALPLLVFIVRDFAARPSETDARITATRKGMRAARHLALAELAEKERLPREAVERFEAAALRFDEAAAVVEEFRRQRFWTLASRSAATELREWRCLAAQARIAAGKAYNRGGLHNEAYRLFRKVTRSPGLPEAELRKAEEEMKGLKGLVDEVEEDTR